MTTSSISQTDINRLNTVLRHVEAIREAVEWTECSDLDKKTRPHIQKLRSTVNVILAEEVARWDALADHDDAREREDALRN